jgi:hypothetical protein
MKFLTIIVALFAIINTAVLAGSPAINDEDIVASADNERYETKGSLRRELNKETEPTMWNDGDDLDDNEEAWNDDEEDIQDRRADNRDLGSYGYSSGYGRSSSYGRGGYGGGGYHSGGGGYRSYGKGGKGGSGRGGGYGYSRVHRTYNGY